MDRLLDRIPLDRLIDLPQHLLNALQSLAIAQEEQEQETRRAIAKEEQETRRAIAKEETQRVIAQEETKRHAMRQDVERLNEELRVLRQHIRVGSMRPRGHSGSQTPGLPALPAPPAEVSTPPVLTPPLVNEPIEFMVQPYSLSRPFSSIESYIAKIRGGLKDVCTVHINAATLKLLRRSDCIAVCELEDWKLRGLYLELYDCRFDVDLWRRRRGEDHYNNFAYSSSAATP
jgi:hypothetical protein